jgi:hypothetical protein
LSFAAAAHACQLLFVADRDKSFFGPVLPQAEDAPDAFSFEELQRIQARRLEVDLVKAASPAWPTTRRFKSIYALPKDPVKPGEHVVSGVRVIVS